LEQIASLIGQHPDVDMVCVAGLQEAAAVRGFGVKKEVLALSYLETDPAEALRYDVIVPIADIATARRVHRAAIAAGLRIRAHIKFDTGMHRLGVMLSELESMWSELITLSGVQIEGIFTHLADTNAVDDRFVQEQLSLFNLMCHRVDPEHRLLQHAIASGGLWYQNRGDIVRIGTLLYGSWKSALQRARVEACLPEITFRPIMTWKTRVLQVKLVQRGGAIGYDRTFCADRQMMIAILPVGYSDGYLRRFSNNGCVMIRDAYAPIVGIISMNLMAIDCTDIPAVAVDDEVILLGPYAHLTPMALAARLHTNPNEITASIHADIPRIIKVSDE